MTTPQRTCPATLFFAQPVTGVATGTVSTDYIFNDEDDDVQSL